MQFYRGAGVRGGWRKQCSYLGPTGLAHRAPRGGIDLNARCLTGPPDDDDIGVQHDVFVTTTLLFEVPGY